MPRFPKVTGWCGLRPRLSPAVRSARSVASTTLGRPMLPRRAFQVPVILRLCRVTPIQLLRLLLLGRPPVRRSITPSLFRAQEPTTYGSGDMQGMVLRQEFMLVSMVRAQRMPVSISSNLTLGLGLIRPPARLPQLASPSRPPVPTH